MSSYNLTANVIIITKGRFSNKNYTYAIPNNLIKSITVNHLVNIKFNKRNVKGIISNIQKYDPLNKTVLSEIISIDYLVEINLVNYITHLSNYYSNPIGHTINTHFNTILEQNDIQKNNTNSKANYFYKKDCRHILSNNIDLNKLNIIYAPSLKTIQRILEFLKEQNISVLFYQKTGGSQESNLTKRIISKTSSGIILSLNTLIFNPHMDKKNLLLHYWDINNYSYTESRKPEFNLIDVSNIQSLYTDHVQYYYSEFPDYRYVREHTKININLPKLSVKYFHDETIKESLMTFLRTQPKNIISAAKYNFEFCSSDLKVELLNAANIIDDEINIYTESSTISNVNVIIEPTVSYMNILNSNRLARLIRYLNILKENKSELYVLTSRDHKFIDLLSTENINKWLLQEYTYRNKYGPSHNSKLVQIKSDIPIELSSNKFSGPVIDKETKCHTYQLTYSLEESKQHNYFEDLKKFEYSFINYL